MADGKSSTSISKSVYCSCQVCGRPYDPKKEVSNLFFTTCGHVMCASCKSKLAVDKVVCLVCSKPMKMMIGVFENNPKSQGLQKYFSARGNISLAQKIRESLQQARHVNNWQKQHIQNRVKLTKDLARREKIADESLQKLKQKNAALEDEVKNLELKLKSMM